ncbi:TetR/AcrR family transcriptional regulator [Kutzneria sp. CA-103260]|uniref:TetR/AcrR family transcriptional regulator n=1 Tax=Kutzneria sp. CA-103260 TaxID=2802641 RepID=UPI001BAAB48E|nr:TetR/AcrR family transcriptional regulator [Kutzneria sp. CA-103260]QUQ67557.1 transcriptional regulator [Kutzneria sp. CA-103260]
MDEVPPFQRARRPEQRELRRQEILDAAEALLAVGLYSGASAEEISLRELARQLDVSKTHIVRYFESREGVFLELLNRMRLAWLEAAATEWPAPPCSPDAVMQSLADTLAARPVLSQLWSLLPSVLERNVSVETVRAYKFTDLAHRTVLAGLIRERVPALTAEDALLLTEHIVIGLVGLWPFSTPPPAVIEATADPRLGRSRVDFAARYGELLQVMLAGLTARGWRTATP